MQMFPSRISSVSAWTELSLGLGYMFGKCSPCKVFNNIFFYFAFFRSFGWIIVVLSGWFWPALFGNWHPCRTPCHYIAGEQYPALLSAACLKLSCMTFFKIIVPKVERNTAEKQKLLENKKDEAEWHSSTGQVLGTEESRNQPKGPTMRLKHVAKASINCVCGNFKQYQKRLTAFPFFRIPCSSCHTWITLHALPATG